MVSNSYLVKEFDIYSMCKTDPKLKVTFELTMLKREFVHAFLVYFDVEFTKGRRTVTISNYPGLSPTLWGHSVFYLDSVLSVNIQDQLYGVFEMNRRRKPQGDQKKKANVNFEISFGFKNDLMEKEEHNRYFTRSGGQSRHRIV